MWQQLANRGVLGLNPFDRANLTKCQYGWPVEPLAELPRHCVRTWKLHPQSISDSSPNTSEIMIVIMSH